METDYASTSIRFSGASRRLDARERFTRKYPTDERLPHARAKDRRLVVFALLTETDLNTRLREMVILRVAERCDGRYVWIQHKDIARIVGVSEEQIAAF